MFEQGKGKSKAQSLVSKSEPLFVKLLSSNGRKKPIEDLVDDISTIPISSIISGSENEEWWGIEIAIQASKNERRGSVGEHSKVGLGNKCYDMMANMTDRAGSHGQQFIRGHTARGLDNTKFEEWKTWHQHLEKNR